ncbi:putative membrane protein YeaQ/YmgE (transglycosylase-associated protein family) [Haloferula luteola]|uniref:Putative membrane protein YeaQ/YmgE (Transglycosylase-associated protein family) n=1 Tax=Haloferula luteola TaxID=595692 RepID=A0A840VDS1_9BACT|nr:GlsB/YeaQ/YmgE family stress response membrane protein [Haloferula luteola]MBB5352778.1 putative membrane protein YeaQ/YmgE (transglycosylase-associated protein family) [Haloferula luteola]
MDRWMGWIILCIISGLAARMVVPGNEKGGWGKTLILGLLGTLVGGWIAHGKHLILFPSFGHWYPSLPALASSILGAIVVLLFWKLVRR